ncbi:hypothetical protein J2S13_000723 [Oikeobacillus pervagus]|uniref:FeoB-associated Cys-rich membrane protein n=1 Tax=Oikeobacillus pervagus TaxID=1325931 RepID=A0AAJ1SZV4_9BACI|nr:FeoB-associated Cys-rich membrane protein [Oikeobacillus pervagus]MDQ0214327.1 hypothetical protein [Oikeobacillus pervagus]
MIANIVIGSAIFGYAGYTLYKFAKKSKKGGACAHCSMKDQCETSRCDSMK